MASLLPRGLVVRVLDRTEQTVGTGVLVGPREIVTCAHVVNTALGLDPRTQDQPSRVLAIEFSLLVDGDDPLQRLEARVERWLPPPRAGAAGDDIAGLVLTSTELPAGAVPARLAVNLPGPGRVVDVFGYPGNPPRPHGGWVEATVRGQVGGGRLQLDSTAETALRIQPGFSGSPVYDRESGRVVGLLAAAPSVASRERDSYAITADRLRLAWPEVLDRRHPRAGSGRGRSGRPVGAGTDLTILHVSDPQFGRNHLFGGNGLTVVDQGNDTLFQRLHDDLAGLARDYGLRPDLMVITGDLAEWGLRTEFEQVVQFLTALTEAVELPRQRVAIVPGNHDINRTACEAYFLRQTADQREPVPPYWPKWEHYAAAFSQFYDGIDSVDFTPDEPWTLFEMPDLAVVVAGLNSTMAESHRDADHYGWVGEQQLRWFADRLTGYRKKGWLRLAAVHHNVVRGAVLDDENLRDADDLDRWLGQPELANLLLHGHTHDGRLHRLSSGLVALSTGSAAVAAGARPQEVPNQYQMLSIRPGSLTRYARQYAPNQRRWIGDTRVSPNGSDWRHNQPLLLNDVGTTFIIEKSDVSEQRDTDRAIEVRRDGPQPGDDFFDRVLEATRVSHPDATVTSRPEGNYLRVSKLLPDGGAEQWPVGVVDGEVKDEHIESFVRVHVRFASADPSVRSELVYSGPPVTDHLMIETRRKGVRLRSFIDYQGLIDLRPLVARQADRLATDRIYPSGLYVPQRYRLLDDTQGPPVRQDLLEKVITWLGADGARFIMVLGDSGRGKTFLVRQLVRLLPEQLPALMPVLVDLRSLEKAPSLDELLAQHLVRQNVDTFHLKKLRYMVRSGRLALLFDGFDELKLRVGYDNAADYLQTLLRAVTDRAKVVLTSRTQHFRSTAQIRTAFGDQVAAIAASRIAVLEDFAEDQILRFLANHYSGDENAAQIRFDLLRDVQDLLGLSRNPLMLSFIAGLDESRLRAVQAEHGQISAAELYRELVDFWLIRETDRQYHRGGIQSLDDKERLEACTAMALRLWATTTLTLPVTELAGEVSATLTRLAERGFTTDQAAHAVGSGSLLVRTDEGEFAFVHQSVMEWLIAHAAARQLRAGEPADILGARPMSMLMLDFLCDLAGHDVARRWAADVLSDPAACEVAKQNGLIVTHRLGSGDRLDLVSVDLRGQDLTNRDLKNANLRGADLRGMSIAGANFANSDLRDADLTGIRMIGGDLAGAQIAGSRWYRAGLVGVSGLNDLINSPELAMAAVAGRDLAEIMIAANGFATHLAFSPEGSLIAVGRGRSVEIVDLTSNQTLRVFCCHTGEVNAVAFSPNGALIATASYDGTARIWDTNTGRHRASLQGHTRGVNAVVFSPDGTLIATASADYTLRIWDTSTGGNLTTLKGHTDDVRGVAFSPDGTLIATASADYTLRIWDTSTGGNLTTLEGHTDDVRGVAFSPDGTLIATASADCTVRIWDTSTGGHRTTLEGHTGEVNAVAFSPDGTLMATASDDGTARIWDTNTGEHRTTLDHGGFVRGVAFSPDGTLIATTSDDGTARIWDTNTSEHRTTLHDRTDNVREVAFSPDGTLIATASDDGTARIWDTSTGGHRTTLEGHTGEVNAVAFSPDGTLIATASYDGTARIWDTNTGGHRTTLDHGGFVLGVAFSPDGTLIATASYDGTARIWDTNTGGHRTTLEGHTGEVNAVAFSPDGTLIATASYDGTARIWDTNTGGHRTTLEGHTGEVNAVAFSPDGTLIATASYDGTARIWDTNTGGHRTTLEGHTGEVNAVAFSPDGTLIATASYDGTARIWDTNTGGHRTTLEGHTGEVNAVAFSPDGTLIATASYDGTARIWNTTAGTWLASLLSLDGGGHSVLLPDGSYKIEGNPGHSLWWAIKLCRFAPGELDLYIPEIHRLPAGAPIIQTLTP